MVTMSLVLFPGKTLINVLKTLNRMRELLNEHCAHSYNLHISHKHNGFYIPNPRKAESGVTAHEQEWTDSWERQREYWIESIDNTAGIIKNS